MEDNIKIKFLVLNYTHPEGYPPTFNAINNLSKIVDEVCVLSAFTLQTKWEYDKNVNLDLIKSEKNRFKLLKAGKFQKLKAYYKYMSKLHRYLKNGSIDIILIYDNVPLFFFRLVSLLLPFTKLPKVWYHNHDVFPLEFYKKYSVNWFGAHTELRLVRKVNYLSLPANERKEHFNLKGFKGKYFFIPNYPSQYIHGNINIRKRIIDNQIRLIYPGNICHKHGFEELIKILCKKVSEKEIHLTLLGDIQEDYREELIEIVKSINSLDKLHFISRKSYFEIPDILQGHHIGWAVNKPLDVTYSTGGTAANKIYEFIAMGMPVLLYDNDHYKSHLGHLESAFFTDLSEASLMKQIQMIIEDYDKYSKSSRSAFVNNFTFESAFNNAAKEVIREIED